MAKSPKVKPKKRGRPATGKDPIVGARLPIDLTVKIDAWGERNGLRSRSIAIRRLLELALASAPAGPRSREKTAAQAAEIAEQEIDRLGDPSATGEERQTRKQRLLKGPKEFRDIRGDLPKAKR